MSPSNKPVRNSFYRHFTLKTVQIVSNLPQNDGNHVSRTGRNIVGYLREAETYQKCIIPAKNTRLGVKKSLERAPNLLLYGVFFARLQVLLRVQ